MLCFSGSFQSLLLAVIPSGDFPHALLAVYILAVLFMSCQTPSVTFAFMLMGCPTMPLFFMKYAWIVQCVEANGLIQCVLWLVCSVIVTSAYVR